jgi:hypothetical protein
MRSLYTAVAEGREDHVFQGLRDENYEAGDTLHVGPETWRVDEVHDLVTMSRDPKTRELRRTLYCTVV